MEDLVGQTEKQLRQYMKNSEKSVMSAVAEKVKIMKAEETESLKTRQKNYA